MAAPDHAQRLFRDFACTRRGVHTWPCGTGERSRSPRGERPRVRAMLVEVLVSSRNTRRAVEVGLALEPRLAGGPHVRAVLLRGVGCLFL